MSKWNNEASVEWAIDISKWDKTSTWIALVDAFKAAQPQGDSDET